VFHPIFEIAADRTKLWALECLIRGPRGTNLEEPTVLFEYARHKRAENLVDRACLSTILQIISELPAEHRYSINIQAATLARDPDFPEFLFNMAEVTRVSPSRLTLEVVEQSIQWDKGVLREVLHSLRRRGVSIAQSGFGGPQSNYQLLLDGAPDFIKLDRGLVGNSSGDARRRIILDSIARLADDLDARIIAEGIETDAAFATVAEMGITLMQGYLFSRVLEPEAIPEPPRNGDLELTRVY
jgi:EAL domain-containing protein (putative c-di-GMP-specific phosphodiesterase class I)